jgi:hypothetical protein
MPRQRRIASRLGVLVASLSVSLIAIYIANDVLDLNLGWKWYLLRQRVFGRPMDGLGQRDDRLGWRPKPGASGTITRPDFTATYTFGPDGYRVVSGSPSDGPVVAFLGCSFTIGTGVNDSEPFPAVIQREYWKSCRIRNLGVYGYGTAHVLLQLEEEFKAGHKIDLALYGWIAHHLSRNYRGRRWLLGLTSWGGRNPLFELENGKLAFKGTIGLEQAVDDSDPTLREREWQITEALLAAIKGLCEEHGTRFAVLLLPWRMSDESLEINRHMMSACQSLGIPCLDLTAERPLGGPENYYKHDGHPVAAWHRSVARLIAQGIDVPSGRIRCSTTR